MLRTKLEEKGTREIVDLWEFETGLKFEERFPQMFGWGLPGESYSSGAGKQGSDLAKYGTHDSAAQILKRRSAGDDEAE